MNSQELHKATDDLGYVRNLVEQSDSPHSPATLYFLWAAIILAGFPLQDFAPQIVPLFWTIAGPAGFLISAAIGWRHSLKIGQMQRRTGLSYSYHFGAVLAAIFLAVPLISDGSITASSFGKFVVLILTLGYFLAGLHLERALGWVSLAMLIGYAVLLFVPTYSWTITGLLVAVAMTVTGLGIGRHATVKD